MTHLTILCYTTYARNLSALHCCDWVMHHYSRSTSAGIFMERLHTTAIFCSCQFLIFDSRPTFIHSAYSESDRRVGNRRVCGWPVEMRQKPFQHSWRYQSAVSLLDLPDSVTALCSIHSCFNSTEIIKIDQERRATCRQRLKQQLPCWNKIFNH